MLDLLQRFHLKWNKPLAVKYDKLQVHYVVISVHKFMSDVSNPCAQKMAASKSILHIWSITINEDVM